MMSVLDHEARLAFAGHYPLGRLLGRGMADVYASADAEGRKVAVKVFRDVAAEGGARRRAEVRTLTSLQHPNLVELINAGDVDGCDFLVMALVDGPSLASLIRRGPLSRQRAGRLVGAVAEGLAYVHARGIVHRDVKPGNVLLDHAGRARLADFGIARMISATRVTKTGFTVGTASYLSPEQVTGAEVGIAADIYALGLLLLECLTSRIEYEGPPVEAALARLHRPPLLPADLPGGWAALITAMTAIKPAARPTAQQVTVALRHLSTAVTSDVASLERAVGTPLRAAAAVPIVCPTPRAAAAGPAGRRRRVLAGAVVGLLVLASAGAISAGAALPHSPSRSAHPAVLDAASAASPEPATETGRAVPPAVPAVPPPVAGAGRTTSSAAAALPATDVGAGRAAAARGRATAETAARPVSASAGSAAGRRSVPSGTVAGGGRTNSPPAANAANTPAQGPAATDRSTRGASRPTPATSERTDEHGQDGGGGGDGSGGHQGDSRSGGKGD